MNKLKTISCPYCKGQGKQITRREVQDSSGESYTEIKTKMCIFCGSTGKISVLELNEDGA